MVRFETNPERYNTVKMLRKLESNVEHLINLDNHITTMEEEILVNPKYVKLGNAAGGGAAAGMGRGGAVSADLDDEALGNAVMPSSARGSRSGSLGPSSSSAAINSNNFNFTC